RPRRRRGAGPPPPLRLSAHAAPPRALPSLLPGVRCRRRGTRRLGILAEVLALQQVAGLRMGELAAASPRGLPGLRRAALLVAKSQDRLLPALRRPHARRVRD